MSSPKIAVRLATRAQAAPRMTLALKTWTPSTIHLVVAEFLRAERHMYRKFDPRLRDMIDNPNFASPIQNHQRIRLLYATRAGLMGEIPPDTAWFAVDGVAVEDLDNVHVIARCQWEDPADKNEVRLVAKRRQVELRSPPAEWPRPILWGHSKEGPFTIIEGNNRMTAFAAHARDETVNVLVGLSPTPCYWHIFDPAMALLHGFWAFDVQRKNVKR